MTKHDARIAAESAFNALGEPVRRERMERRRLELTARFIDRVAGGFTRKRVLELGSSFGVNLLMAKRLGAAKTVGVDYFVFPDVHANDFTVEQTAFAGVRRVWDQEGIEVHRHDLAEPLPFADGAFDLVVSNAVIEHLYGIHKQLFLEAHRVLAPGGHLVFTTPNLASLLKRLRFLVGRSPLWDIKDYWEQGMNFTGHVREFTVPECRAFLEWSGFDAVFVTSLPGYFKWRWLAMPKKWHTFFLQSLSRLWPTWGDLVLASGRKK